MADSQHTRRAVLLLLHHGRRDEAGVNEVVRQVREDRDPAASTYLVLALLQMFEGLAPLLYTEAGLRMLSAAVMELAEVETS